MFDSMILDLYKINKRRGVVSIIRNSDNAAIVIETLQQSIFLPAFFNFNTHLIKIFTFLASEHAFPKIETIRESIGGVKIEGHPSNKMLMISFNKAAAPKKALLFSILGISRGESESWEIPDSMIEKLEDKLKEIPPPDVTPRSWAESKMKTVGIDVSPMFFEAGVGRSSSWLNGILGFFSNVSKHFTTKPSVSTQSERTEPQHHSEAEPSAPPSPYTYSGQSSFSGL